MVKPSDPPAPDAQKPATPAATTLDFAHKETESGALGGLLRELIKGKINPGTGTVSGSAQMGAINFLPGRGLETAHAAKNINTTFRVNVFAGMPPSAHSSGKDYPVAGYLQPGTAVEFLRETPKEYFRLDAQVGGGYGDRMSLNMGRRMSSDLIVEFSLDAEPSGQLRKEIEAMMKRDGNTVSLKANSDGQWKLQMSLKKLEDMNFTLNNGRLGISTDIGALKVGGVDVGSLRLGIDGGKPMIGFSGNFSLQ